MWCTDVKFQNVWMVRSFSKKRIFFTARAAFKFFFFQFFFLLETEWQSSRWAIARNHAGVFSS